MARYWTVVARARGKLKVTAIAGFAALLLDQQETGAGW
jgi:hypothetical protein